ncbi:MAG: efflux RND transporter permease subunit, partial [Enterobacter hormaechei]|nr:efflux RND transporter permease subunit [Enterobacter hormaechei]
MSVIGLVNQAVAWYAASAVLAFLFAMRKPLSGAIAGIGGAVASAMLVVAGGAALLMPERIHGGMLQFLHLTIRVGGVNALWLLAIGLFMVGLICYLRLGVSALPNIEIPVIFVHASQSGADAATMASTVTAPLERHLGQLPGIDRMRSSSSEGSSLV